jgi:ketosteroid isomerase-like protein
MSPQTTTQDAILDFGRRWAEAEQQGDADFLDAIVVDDFTLVGPLGFVLDRQQWSERYRTGDLVTSALEWKDVQVREYGTTAIAVGVHAQKAAYRGQANDGSFRSTHVLVQDGGEWKLASVHMSPITAPPGRP